MKHSPYEVLPQLLNHRIPVYANPSVQAKADILSQQFDQAYSYLTTLLAIPLDVHIAFLSKQDWSRLTQSPYYGAVIYDYPNSTIVAGAEATSFWQPLVKHLQTVAPELFQHLQIVYRTADNTIDLTPNIDLWMVHDLGHACHLHHQYWFPRKWLMELWANLCLYTYIVEQAPEQYVCATTFFSVLHELPRSLIANQRLADFEQQYVELPLTDYSWFSGQFMHLAHRLYQQFGETALLRLWDTFVLGQIQETKNQPLWQQIHHKDTAIADILEEFEQQYQQEG